MSELKAPKKELVIVDTFGFPNSTGGHALMNSFNVDSNTFGLH